MKNHLSFTLLFAIAVTSCFGEVTSSYGTPPPGSSDGTNTTTSAGITTGLPCDVQNVLQSLCVSCHSDPPTSGALMGLVTYADLTAPAKSDPTKKVADVCVTRMQDMLRPMPPGAGATSSQVQTLQSWIAAGYPQGACGGVSAGGSYDTPVQCTSGQTYSGRGGDDDGSQYMNPGLACIQCHGQRGVRRGGFSVAGTVYPTAHEPDMCLGARGLTVVVTDAAGNTLSLTTNSSGNFLSTTTIQMPYRAKVVDASGKERAMATPQTSGDCNACHTEPGANGAPGRIMAP